MLTTDLMKNTVMVEGETEAKLNVTNKCKQYYYLSVFESIVKVLIAYSKLTNNKGQVSVAFKGIESKGIFNSVNT